VSQACHRSPSCCSHAPSPCHTAVAETTAVEARVARSAASVSLAVPKLINGLRNRCDSHERFAFDVAHHGEHQMNDWLKCMIPAQMSSVTTDTAGLVEGSGELGQHVNDFVKFSLDFIRSRTSRGWRQWRRR